MCTLWDPEHTRPAQFTLRGGISKIVFPADSRNHYHCSRLFKTFKYSAMPEDIFVDIPPT